MRECDLIMKGGITSGVVYPHAIVEIAKAYRLRSIGGTSAGAIAAVLAAAAEYRRQAAPAAPDFAGYDGVAAIAKELGEDMQSLFQPSPALAPLFDILIAAVGAGQGKGLVARLLPPIFRAYWGRTLLAGGLGAGMAAVGIGSGEPWLIVLGLVLALVLAVLLIGLALFKAVFRDLPAHDFGICPGITLPGQAKPGFTDWIADKIDRIAGNLGPDGALGAPLTVGQLAERGVKVATMTTDLSSQRPYQLPLKSNHHLFSRREFAALFPERVLRHLTREDRRFEAKDPELPDDLYWLPTGDDFPVLLVARMSLSFPGLIRAVPLYRFDHQLDTGPEGGAEIRRCLFSDGGISSNFPIHFFDAFLPRRPTFGIALASWEQERHGGRRVHLPERGRQSTDIPVREVKGIAGFLFSILNTAKDWQDTLQSLLPGYAERIVEIRLDDSSEGGLNLAMGGETIARLADYGREAGQTLVSDFDFDEHRYRRALSLLPTLEGSLEGLSKSYAAGPDGAEADALTYAQVLTDYPARIYTKNTRTWRETVLDAFAGGLAEIGAQAAENHAQEGRKSVRKGHVPPVDARISLIAEADRVPARVAEAAVADSES